MKIDILCNDGSPLGVTPKTIYGDNVQPGVGGAELALLTMSEAWVEDGHEVVLYNNPRETKVSSLEQRNIDSFNPIQERDVLIVFRSPNTRAIGAKGLKVWWSCDQFTIGDFKYFSTVVDKIVCISNFHSEYFRNVYNITNAIVIDLPVREQDYPEINLNNKIPGRLLFASVPQRGLDILSDMWEELKSINPDVSLVITSDYRLWGCQSPNDFNHRYKWMRYINDDIQYIGAVNRKQLIKEQMKAQILAYPCTYDELFCITCAEAQYAGVYPVTSGKGALQTTNMGTIIDIDPMKLQFRKYFIDEIIYLLDDAEELRKIQNEVMKMAKERFNIKNILNQWYERVLS